VERGTCVLKKPVMVSRRSTTSARVTNPRSTAAMAAMIRTRCAGGAHVAAVEHFAVSPETGCAWFQK